LIRERAARVVGPRQRAPDTCRTAASLLVVEVALVVGVEHRETEQRRRVTEPRLREAQEIVFALRATFEMELEALPVAEHVVVPELEESGHAALRGVPGARGCRPDALLLHPQRDVDVGALGRREV